MYERPICWEAEVDGWLDRRLAGAGSLAETANDPARNLMWTVWSLSAPDADVFPVKLCLSSISSCHGHWVVQQWFGHVAHPKQKADVDDCRGRRLAGASANDPAQNLKWTVQSLSASDADVFPAKLCLSSASSCHGHWLLQNWLGRVAHPKYHSRCLTVGTVIPPGLCIARTLSAESRVEICLSGFSVP